MPRNRKFSDEWYEHGRNPFPKLKEIWYQKYIAEHQTEFGLSNLEGPFDYGVDFYAELDGAKVPVEVEKDYLAFRKHDHQITGILIVGVLERPLPSMTPYLPKVVLNLDPQTVLDWSRLARDAYRQEMNRRRSILPEKLEWVRQNLDRIESYRVVGESVQVFWKEVHRCECGGDMEEGEVDIDQMSEGQMANHFAGFDKPFVCYECGNIELKDVGVFDD